MTSNTESISIWWRHHAKLPTQGPCSISFCCIVCCHVPCISSPSLKASSWSAYSNEKRHYQFCFDHSRHTSIDILGTRDGLLSVSGPWGAFFGMVANSQYSFWCIKAKFNASDTYHKGLLTYLLRYTVMSLFIWGINVAVIPVSHALFSQLLMRLMLLIYCVVYINRCHKQRVLMHRHQGWNVRQGLCHIYMRYLYIYELFIAFVSFVVCSLL